MYQTTNNDFSEIISKSGANLIIHLAVIFKITKYDPELLFSLNLGRNEKVQDREQVSLCYAPKGDLGDDQEKITVCLNRGTCGLLILLNVGGRTQEPSRKRLGDCEEVCI